jgi:hypothetical protein
VSSTSRQWRLVHRGPRLRWSTAFEPIPQDFPIEKYSENLYSWGFYRKALVLFYNEPVVCNFTKRPLNLKNNSRKVLSLRKIHKISPKTSKFHIFSTTTPNPVIPAPKFSGSLLLSFYEFI